MATKLATKNRNIPQKPYFKGLFSYFPTISNRGVTFGKSATSTPPHSLWELGFQDLESVSLWAKKCVTKLKGGVPMND